MIKLKQFLAQLPHLPRAAQLIWQAARTWTLAWALLLIVQGLLPVITVYLTRDLVDTLSAVLQGGGLPAAQSFASFRQPALLIAMMVLVLLTGEVVQSLLGWVRTAQAELVQDKISDLIHNQAVTLDLSFYDRADYYDSLHVARIDAISRPVALLENFGLLLQNSLTFLAMAGVLLSFGWWLPLTLAIGMLPVLFVVVRVTLRQHAWRQRTTQQRRRANYYDWLLADQEAAAEVRIFGLGGYFRQAYQELRHRLRNERIALAKNEVLAQLPTGAFSLLILGLAMSWMIWRMLQGQVTLGALAMFYQAFTQGQRLMQTLLGSVGQIYSNILFLENLFIFLDLKPQLVAPATPTPPPFPLRQGIRFDNVTFHYPGSERVALDRFSIYIPAGQVVAIVGENGAGKSTLIKLICRFYDPDAGRVLLDDVDLRDLTQAELWQQITVLFQDPVQYHVSAAQNIALGDLVSQPSQPAIQQAAQAAGADDPIQRLPAGYETILGKWFGGAELSGGEWQRLALARAFLRQAPLILLDEPTSAMDSWAEADWIGRFRQLVAGRTAVIITHRFTTAMQADTIHVMVEGKIIESGNHAQLLVQNGRYAQSWRQQMREWGAAHQTITI